MGAVSAQVRAFFLRGNVAGLTVAVAVGYAFVAFAQTFVDGLLLPVLLGIVSADPLQSLSFGVGENEVYYGLLVGSFIAFAVVLAAAYLLVVVPVNRYVARRRADEAPVA